MNNEAEKSTLKHIVVIGGGLAGLSLLGALLQEHKKSTDFRIDVYDKDGAINERKNGYGLTLTYNPR